MDTLAVRVAARYKKKTISDKGNPIYLYSEGQIARRNADKAKRLEGLRSSIDKLRGQVKKDLRSGDLTALAVALIDETYERVGNSESAGDGHYGVTGWTKKHISFGKGSAKIKYVGKSGVKHEKTVSNKAVVKALRDAYDKCSGDCIFDHEDGRVDATKVNAYLNKFDISAKDLRGFHANREMQERLRAARKGKLSEDKKEREKQLKAEFKAALEGTAEAVGHEPSTLKSQYLVPGLEEQFLKDGTVTDKMVKRVAARFAATVQRLDLAWVEGLRKDFLTLLKNIPRVKDYPMAHELREAIGVYRKRFEDLFFAHFLNHDLKYSLGLDEGLVQWYDKRLRSTAWSFTSELLSMPICHADKYRSEEGCFVQFQEKAPEWKSRLMRRAQTFWKEMKDVIETFTINRQRAIEVRMPTVENATIEGFKLIMKSFEPGDKYHEEELSIFREGLRLYRRRASSVAPILIQKQLPVIVEFKTSLDKGGEYHGDGTITFYASSAANKGPAWVAHAMAHEMGHHLFKTYLSSEAQDYWYALIRGDYGDLDLKKLLEEWPGDAWAFNFSEVIGDKDPLLALQVEAISNDLAYGELQKKEDFQRLYDKGTRILKVPKHPITGYANKNPEEAFCETLGLLVAYGPNALHAKIRWWLDTVLPGAIKIASLYDLSGCPELPATTGQP